MTNMLVEYLDHMGNDLSVVNSARVSFKKKSEWDLECVDEVHHVYRETLSKKDRGLIRFLAKGLTSADLEHYKKQLEFYSFTSTEAEELFNEIREIPTHWTPFAQTSIQLYFKVPIFVARQMNKHQVGFVTNEVSRRYVDDDFEFFQPDYFRKRNPDKKQGSLKEKVDDNHHCSVSYEDWIYDAIKYYEHLLENGVAPEQARMVLPQSMMTEFVTAGNLYNWSRFVKTRRREDAQYEIRWVANEVEKVLLDLFPVSAKELLA